MKEEHTIALHKFFNKKGDLDLKNRLQQKAGYKKKNLTFNVSKEQFSLVNYKGGSVVSVKRKPMILVEEQLNDYNKKINTIQKQLLYMKYDILFEYEPLESITDIINNIMEPLEKKLNTLMKTRTKFNDKYLQHITVKKDEIITDKEEDKEDDIDDIIKNLKNLDSNNYDSKEQKINYFKELIKMQKEKLDEKQSMSKLNEIIEIPANMNNDEPYELNEVIDLNIVENSNSNSNSNENESKSENESKI